MFKILAANYIRFIENNTDEAVIAYYTVLTLRYRTSLQRKAFAWAVQKLGR